MAQAQPHDDDATPTCVVELVVNLDDVTAEQVGAVIDRLIAAGALDAWATPITMKKNRPGLMLSVLARPQQQQQFAEQLLNDTGSFGVRYRDWQRTILQREVHQRQTPLGPIQIKVGLLDGKPITAKPEFEQVLTLAQNAGVSLAYARRVADAQALALQQELQQQTQQGGRHA